MKSDNTFTQQYELWKKANTKARRAAIKSDLELAKLIQLADMTRRTSKIINISKDYRVEIHDQFRGSTKVFAPAFARRWKVVEKRSKINP